MNDDLSITGMAEVDCVCPLKLLIFNDLQIINSSSYTENLNFHFYVKLMWSG